MRSAARNPEGKRWAARTGDPREILPPMAEAEDSLTVAHIARILRMNAQAIRNWVEHGASRWWS